MAVPKKKEQTGAFEQALKATSSPKVPAKKTTVREIPKPPAKVIDAIDHFNRAKEEMAAAKAEMDIYGETILEFFRKTQDADGFAGNYQNSLKLFGKKTHATVVATNKFSINPEDEDSIHGLVGEFFDFLFSKKYEVRLKADVFESEEKANELMQLIGEKFGEFFETTVALKTKENFTKEIYNFVDEEKLAMLRVFIKQAKPSIK